MRRLLVLVGCAACGRGFFNPQPHDGPPGSTGSDAPVGSPIAYVQSGNASSSLDVLAVPLPLAQRAGNTNIVVVAWAGGAIATLDDDHHNTYASSIGPLSSQNNVTQSIFYATNILPGANQIRIELSATPLYFAATVVEYAGVDQVQPIDGSTGSQGGAEPAASGELHLTSDGDLEVAAVSSDSPFSTTLPGFTLAAQGNNVLLEDTQCATSGTYAAITDAAVPGNWVDEAIGLRRAN